MSKSLVNSVKNGELEVYAVFQDYDREIFS